MPPIHAILTRTISLGPEKGSTTVGIGGRYDPDTDTFTYAELGRGGRVQIVLNASQIGSVKEYTPESPILKRP